jgi:hypothetical protein
MMKLRKANEEDIIITAENALDGQYEDRSAESIRKWAAYEIAGWPAYAAIYKEKVVAVAGLRLVRPSVGHIWIVMSKDINKKSFSFMRDAMLSMKKMTEILVRQYSLKKVRALSRIGFGGSQRLLEHLGFERLRRTTKTHYIYVLRS